MASVCLEAHGKDYFTTTYMVKADSPIKTVKDLKGGTIGVVVEDLAYLEKLTAPETGGLARSG